MEAAALRKMVAWLTGPETGAKMGRVCYKMAFSQGTIAMEAHIGHPFTLRFTGHRTCIACGREVKKFYGQGLCWNCFNTAPEASPCIIRPELCRAHLGEGRDVQWERDHHLQEHLVYLSYTGNVKVGVTRATQVPVRWIDQGAMLAVPIARTPYRQLAGAIEVDLKRHFSDRTDWRRMLLLDDPRPGLAALEEARARVPDVLAPELRPFLLAGEPVLQLDYPLAQVPPKLVSVQLDKLPLIGGRLQGIKGQYLVWADGRVLNVRNHIGFHVEVDGS